MTTQYAKQQPAGFKNKIENVAIVGATGNVGKYTTASLLKGGKHKITAITRGRSSGSVPDGVEVKTIDYDNVDTIVEALQGQDALVIAMGTAAPPEQQSKLIQAAAKAKVPWVLPSEYSYAFDESEGAGKDTFLGPRTAPYRREIESTGVSSWIGITHGFWYDYSIALPTAFGFDVKKRTVTLFGDGNVKIDTTTLPTAGQAVANLLTWKVLPEDENDKSPTLSQYKNNFICFNSYHVSQNDMFESVLRVTGTKKEDWKVTSENPQQRFATAGKELQTGDGSAFVRLLYTRCFYPDGSSDLVKRFGLANEALGLPKENLDAGTKLGLEKFLK